VDDATEFLGQKGLASDVCGRMQMEQTGDSEAKNNSVFGLSEERGDVGPEPKRGGILALNQRK
jgi:hypothetical protein